jgi:hypothetical protein
MMLASLFLLPWFTAQMPHGQVSGFAGASRLSIDLRSVSTACSYLAGPCDTPLTVMARSSGGFTPYLTLATMTLWSSLVFGVLVVLQVVLRVLTDVPRKNLSTVGYVAGGLTVSIAWVATYIFGPELVPFHVEPTLGPMVFYLGCILGIVALYYAARPLPDDSVSAQRTIPPARVWPARSRA